MRSWKSSDPGLCIVSAACLALGWWSGQILVYAVPLVLLTIRAIAMPDPEPVEDEIGLPPWYVWLLVATALALPPGLSDDHQRYLFEGYAQARGFSPYSHSPESLYGTLDHPAEGKVNHAELATIYPPLAQYLFRIGAMIMPNLAGWKLVLLAALALFYRHPGGTRIIPFLITPLILFEGLWNAHLDVLGLIPAFLLVAALEKGDGPRTGIYLGLTAALKLVPAILLPVCLLHLKGRQRLWAVLGFTGVLLICFAPYLHEGAALFDSFLIYARTWQFNNLPFNILSGMIGKDSARIVMGVLLVIAVGYVSLTGRASIREKLTAIWVALFVFSPTLFPWYLIWLIPFVPDDRRKWLHLAYAACAVSYLVLIPYRANGVWAEAWWWLVPEWLALGWCFFALIRPRAEASP